MFKLKSVLRLSIVASPRYGPNGVAGGGNLSAKRLKSLRIVFAPSGGHNWQGALIVFMAKIQVRRYGG